MAITLLSPDCDNAGRWVDKGSLRMAHQRELMSSFVSLPELRGPGIGKKEAAQSSGGARRAAPVSQHPRGPHDQHPPTPASLRCRHPVSADTGLWGHITGETGLCDLHPSELSAPLVTKLQHREARPSSQEPVAQPQRRPRAPRPGPGRRGTAGQGPGSRGNPASPSWGTSWGSCARRSKASWATVLEETVPGHEVAWHHC